MRQERTGGGPKELGGPNDLEGLTWQPNQILSPHKLCHPIILSLAKCQNLVWSGVIIGHLIQDAFDEVELVGGRWLRG